LGHAIDEIELDGDLILVGTYIASNMHTFKGADGKLHEIQLTDSAVQENLWQGCCGLLLKKGPTAWVDDEAAGIKWYGRNYNVGDWVILKYSDATEMHLFGVSVRFLYCGSVKGKISDPRYISEKPHPALR
jgi:hypothetical protein